MRRARVAVFVHFVWATWDRLPLLEERWLWEVYRAIGAKCAELRATPIAIGGVEDHVHLLVELPPTVTMAELVGQVKGMTAHLINHQLAPDGSFRWQGAYGAFSVEAGGVGRVAEYIRRQREHHAVGTVVAEWEGQVVEGV